MRKAGLTDLPSTIANLHGALPELAERAREDGAVLLL